jgi:hypothetical protein
MPDESLVTSSGLKCDQAMEIYSSGDSRNPSWQQAQSHVTNCSDCQVNLIHQHIGHGDPHDPRLHGSGHHDHVEHQRKGHGEHTKGPHGHGKHSQDD